MLCIVSVDPACAPFPAGTPCEGGGAGLMIYKFCMSCVAVGDRVALWEGDEVVEERRAEVGWEVGACVIGLKEVAALEW